jgi:hypothetical protein
MNRKAPWKRLFSILAFPALLASCASGQGNSFWQTQNIYQIITDRFYDGDTANDNAEGTYSPGNPTGVHGGDVEGIEQKLDYIKSLGATAIWISGVPSPTYSISSRRLTREAYW